MNILEAYLSLLSVLFFCHCTGTAFRHLFSTNFQSFNPIESFDVQESSRDFLACKSYDDLRSQCYIAPYKYM
jgi:hypothetical protein